MFNILMFCTIFIIYLIFGSKLKNKNILFLRITFLFFTFLIGFRAITMGNDTLTYLDIFDGCRLYKWQMLDIDRFEKGYMLFNIILGFIVSNHRIFLLMFSIIFNYLVYNFIKKNSNDYLLSVLTYFGFMFFYISMTMYRQFFAMVIVLGAFKFVKEGKFFRFLFMIILAHYFHSTAVVAIFIYPLYHIKFTNKTMIISILLTLVCSIFLNSILTFLMDGGYFDYGYETRENGLSLANSIYALTFLVMFIFARMNYKKLYDENNEYSFILYIFLIAFCLNLVSIKMNIFSRITEYYSIFSIICLPNLINLFTVKNKKILYVIVTLFFMIYSTTIIVLRPEWNSGYNYKICNINDDCFK